MNPIDEIKSTAKGAAILLDWFGDGGVPVEDFKAEARAEVCEKGCDGKGCPKNRFPKWWESAKQAVAERIKEALAVKNRMELSVSNEDSIGMCAACTCSLPLKVWTPIKHIKEHTTPEQLAKFPSFCWQKLEIEASK